MFKKDTSPKICKCGDSKEDHIKPGSKLKIIGYCRKCPCTEYMRNTRPNTEDKIIVGLSIFMIGMFVFLAVTTGNVIYSDPETLKTKIAVPIKVIMLMFFLVMLWFCSLFSSGIAEYFRYKKRKDYSKVNYDKSGL